MNDYVVSDIQHRRVPCARHMLNGNGMNDCEDCRIEKITLKDGIPILVTLMEEYMNMLPKGEVDTLQ